MAKESCYETSYGAYLTCARVVSPVKQDVEYNQKKKKRQEAVRRIPSVLEGRKEARQLHAPQVKEEKQMGEDRQGMEGKQGDGDGDGDAPVACDSCDAREESVACF